MLQRIGHRLDGLEAREVVEERVAGMGHEHAIARVTEQLEQQRVRVARAGGEGHPVRVHRTAVAEELAGNGLACARQAEGLRVVGQARRIGQRRQQIRGIGEAHSRRV